MSTGRSGVATADDDARQPAGVVGVDRHDDLGEPIAHPAIEASDDAEVDERDDATRQDEDVAGVRIGMEQAVDEHLPQHGVRATSRHEAPIEVGGLGGADGARPSRRPGTPS